MRFIKIINIEWMEYWRDDLPTDAIIPIERGDNNRNILAYLEKSIMHFQQNTMSESIKSISAGKTAILERMSSFDIWLMISNLMENSHQI